MSSIVAIVYSNFARSDSNAVSRAITTRSLAVDASMCCARSEIAVLMDVRNRSVSIIMLSHSTIYDSPLSDGGEEKRVEIVGRLLAFSVLPVSGRSAYLPP